MGRLTKAHILLEEVGWTQKEVCEEAGISTTSCAQYLQGKFTSAPLKRVLHQGINRRRAERGMAPLPESELEAALGDFIEVPVHSPVA